jgi:hypothetical protein
LFFSPSFFSRLSLRSFTGFPMRFPTPLLMRSAPLRSLADYPFVLSPVFPCDFPLHS